MRSNHKPDTGYDKSTVLSITDLLNERPPFCEKGPAELPKK